jgi:hypothetical protein
VTSTDGSRNSAAFWADGPFPHVLRRAKFGPTGGLRKASARQVVAAWPALQKSDNLTRRARTGGRCGRHLTESCVCVVAQCNLLSRYGNRTYARSTLRGLRLHKGNTIHLTRTLFARQSSNVPFPVAGKTVMACAPEIHEAPAGSASARNREATVPETRSAEAGLLSPTACTVEAGGALPGADTAFQFSGSS